MPKSVTLRHLQTERENVEVQTEEEHLLSDKESEPDSAALIYRAPDLTHII